MSEFRESLRAAIVARAGRRCEYCHLPAEGQVGRFPIDHIRSRSAGGATEPGNLALACAHCNAYKWAHTDGVDPGTGVPFPLFHPRRDRWDDHFAWSAADPALLIGLTPIGRATIARLGMNHPELKTARRLLAALGLFP